MPDLLCSLVRIPPLDDLLDKLRSDNIHIRRANPWEQAKLRRFILEHFSEGWADECLVGFTHQPASVYIALHGDEIIGFGAYECTRRNYFGPTGVNEAYRGKGIGKALFLACLFGLQEMGYAYAIIGDAGPVDFYKKAVGAIDIPLGDRRGIYTIKEEPRFMK